MEMKTSGWCGLPALKLRPCGSMFSRTLWTGMLWTGSPRQMRIIKGAIKGSPSTRSQDLTRAVCRSGIESATSYVRLAKFLIIAGCLSAKNRLLYQSLWALLLCSDKNFIKVAHACAFLSKPLCPCMHQVPRCTTMQGKKMDNNYLEAGCICRGWPPS